MYGFVRARNLVVVVVAPLGARTHPPGVRIAGLIWFIGAVLNPIRSDRRSSRDRFQKKKNEVFFVLRTLYFLQQ